MKKCLIFPVFSAVLLSNGCSVQADPGKLRGAFFALVSSLAGGAAVYVHKNQVKEKKEFDNRTFAYFDPQCSQGCSKNYDFYRSKMSALQSDIKNLRDGKGMEEEEPKFPQPCGDCLLHQKGQSLSKDMHEMDQKISNGLKATLGVISGGFGVLAIRECKKS